MSARSRTITHMQKLLAASAAAVATSITGCSKDRGYAVVDPMPMPPPRCFDPLKTVRAAVKKRDDADHMFVVRLDLVPGVKGISFEKVEGKASGWTKDGGKLEVKYEMIARTATHVELEVEVPPPAVDVSVLLDGLVCEVEHAKRIKVMLKPNAPVPSIEVDGAVYDYE